MSPAELFHRAGVALFGDQYVAPLAHALDIADKGLVRKMAAGKSDIRPATWDLVTFLMVKRREENEALLIDLGSKGLGLNGYVRDPRAT